MTTTKLKFAAPILLLSSMLAALCCIAGPAQAQNQARLERALNAAMTTYEAAFPKLKATEFGVDTAAYRDAMSFFKFRSAYWGGTITLDTQIRAEASGSCSRFAAFVRIPPENGAVQLVLCPQFFSDGADALRELTILHELVHVVAGKDECQAMAFAAGVEQAAKGYFTAVDAYWRNNDCANSPYRLP